MDFWCIFSEYLKMHADKNIELNHGQREADPGDHVTWQVALGDDVIW